MALAHRPLFHRMKLDKALRDLGIKLRVDPSKQGRIRGDVGAAEMTGVLTGALQATLFGLDPQLQPEDFSRSFHGWVSTFVAGTDTERAHDDAILSALALNAMWTGHMLQAAAEQRHRRHAGTDARPGSVLLAAQLANQAGILAMTAVAEIQNHPERKGDTAAAAKTLTELARAAQQLADAHPEEQPQR